MSMQKVKVHKDALFLKKKTELIKRIVDFVLFSRLLLLCNLMLCVFAGHVYFERQVVGLEMLTFVCGGIVFFAVKHGMFAKKIPKTEISAYHAWLTRNIINIKLSAGVAIGVGLCAWISIDWKLKVYTLALFSLAIVFSLIDFKLWPITMAKNKLLHRVAYRCIMLMLILVVVCISLSFPSVGNKLLYKLVVASLLAVVLTLISVREKDNERAVELAVGVYPYYVIFFIVTINYLPSIAYGLIN